MPEKVRSTLKQRLEKLEGEAVYCEKKADEFNRRAAAIRERIATMKREAAEVVA